MSQASEGDRQPIEELAEEFLARIRAGEDVAIDHYAKLHPDLAEEIRLLFPTLLVMEDLGPIDTLDEIESRSLEPGIMRLGDYRILREIGRGGMGVVYEAEQESLERHVALKVLPAASFLDGNKRARFLLEARSAARLHHSNIVPVFSVGQQQGLYYYAMQLIQGHGLDAVLDQVRLLRSSEKRAVSTISVPLSSPEAVAETLLSGIWISSSGPEPEFAQIAARTPVPSESGQQVTDSHPDFLSAYHQNVTRIGLQVAEALAYAHGEGVLHRDIKPSNLILDARAQAWVTDFGLAKADDSGDLTGTGDIVGTLRYLPPERFEGRSDARTDVYGLGVTLYELLALKPAFTASGREALVQQVLHQDPLRLRRIDPSIPRDLETVVHKAIEKAPEHRYASAGDMAEDLRRCLDRRPILARRVSLSERLWRWCRRNPMAATSVTVITGLLMTIALVSTSAAVTLRAERNVSRLAEHQKAVQLAEAKLRTGRALRRSGKAGQRLESLKALRESLTHAAPLDVRNEVIASLSLSDVEVIGSFTGQRYYDEYGERFAVRTTAAELRLRSSEDPEHDVAVLHIEPGALRVVHWSRDGRWLGVRLEQGAKATLIVFDLESKTELGRIDGRSGSLPFSFGWDGTCVVHAEANGELVMRRLPDFQVTTRVSNTVAVDALWLSPDGRHLAMLVAGVTINCRIWDLQAHEEVACLQHPREIYSATWQPQSRVLVTTCGNGSSYVWDTTTWERIRVLDGHVNEAVRAVFTHDGGVVATAGWDGLTRFWSLLGGQQLVVAQGALECFSRDDRLGVFLTGDGTRGGHLRLHQSQAYRLLAVPMKTKGPWEVAFSKDGRWMAAGCARDGVRLWSLVDLNCSVQLPAGDTQSVVFDPRDGALLTISTRGLLRWPLTLAESNQWTVGPPERIGPVGSKVTLDRTGEHRGVLGVRDLIVQANERLAPRTPLGRHPRATFLAMSPDARYLASGTWKGRDARLWDTATGQLLRSWPASSAEVRFSPDGRWLGVGSAGDFRFMATSTWETVLESKSPKGVFLGRGFAFAPDGSHAVITTSPNSATLISLPQGDILARIESPSDGVQLMTLAVSADGRYLAASSGNNFLQLWNLSHLRHRLREWGLDWNEKEPPGQSEVIEGETVSLTLDPGAPEPSWGSDRASVLPEVFLARLRLLGDGIAAEPTRHAELLEERARVWLDGDFLDDALADVVHSIEIGGASVARLYLKAQILTAKRRHDAALEAVEACLQMISGARSSEVTPLEVAASLAHARALAAVGRVGAAVLASDRALALGAPRAATLVLKAQALWDWERGDRKAAMNVVREGLAECPDHADLLTTHGVLLFHEGDFDAAERSLVAALTKPGATLEGIAWLYRGLCRSQASDSAEARVFLESSLAWRDSVRPPPLEWAGMSIMIARLRKELTNLEQER